jgi:hypothetical protein
MIKFLVGCGAATSGVYRVFDHEARGLLKGAARLTRARVSTGFRPTTQNLGNIFFESPCGVATFVVTSAPYTGAYPLARLCAGPDFARCVHKNRYTRGGVEQNLRPSLV